MAFAVRETAIANPASRASGKKKRRKNMAARHLSAKQIKAGFGGKRRRAALKTKRHNPRTAATRTAPKRHRASTQRKPARKQNLGEVVSILLPGMVGNPARRKGRKTMAATKRRSTKRATGQRNAGSRRKTFMKVSRRHARRSNPGQVTEYAKLGLAIVGGAVGSKMATQLILSASNTGWMGYLGNLVATLALGWGASKAFKDKMISQGVVGGGIAQLAVRIISDQTPYGSYLAGAGVGDYQASAFLTPQRMLDARNNASLQQPNWAAAPAAVVVTHSGAAAAPGVGGFDWN